MNGSGSSRVGRAARRNGTARCWRRCRGRTTCSPTTRRSCSGASPCSPRRSISPPPKRSPATATSTSSTACCGSSTVRSWSTSPTRTATGCLETLRQYGADRLAEAGETEETRERHARYFLDFAERMSPELNDARYKGTSDTLAAELENMRAAADWCIDSERHVALAQMLLRADPALRPSGCTHRSRRVVRGDHRSTRATSITNGSATASEISPSCTRRPSRIRNRQNSYADATNTPTSPPPRFPSGHGSERGWPRSAPGGPQRIAQRERGGRGQAAPRRHVATLADVRRGGRGRSSATPNMRPGHGQDAAFADRTGMPTLIASGVTTAVQAHL